MTIFMYIKSILSICSVGKAKELHVLLHALHPVEVQILATHSRVWDTDGCVTRQWGKWWI